MPVSRLIRNHSYLAGSQPVSRPFIARFRRVDPLRAAFLAFLAVFLAFFGVRCVEALCAWWAGPVCQADLVARSRAANPDYWRLRDQIARSSDSVVCPFCRQGFDRKHRHRCEFWLNRNKEVAQ